MKTTVLLISFLASLTIFAAPADNNGEDSFTQQAYCEINAGHNATCEICNFDSYRPIKCHMSISGRTLYGFWFKGNQHAAIPYGKCMYGYVYANNPMRDPLISAEASATCRRRH